MNLNPRQQEILQRVRQTGFVSIDDLVAHFQVTPQTIRRDINTLCDLGLLRRFHGGAGVPSSVENIAYPAWISGSSTFPASTRTARCWISITAKCG
jgi:DeoR family transcriptional regulator, glycerol-3-phosphate regulon repressor